MEGAWRTQVKLVNGFWCPDYDNNLHLAMTPPRSFAGRATYTLSWFLRCLPLVKDFRRAIDVGAHIGLWSWPMSRCFAEVVAFEPIPEHAACFRANMRGVTNIVLHETALGEREHTMDMAIKPPWSVKARMRTNEAGRPISVFVGALDTLINDGDPVDFIKIDCEGYELRVVQGAERVIRQSKPLILVEQKPNNTVRYGLGTQAVDLLQEWGAVVHWEWGGDFCMGWV